MSPWENITSELANARNASMLNTDRFARQNKIDLDRALLMSQLEQEAAKILNNPALLARFMQDSGISTDGLPLPSSGNVSPLSIGIGARTDEIKEDALKEAILGLFTGGLSGAVSSGAKSYVTDTAKTLFDVNNSPDPIAALNALQRWTTAPVETRTGQTPAEIQAQSSFDPTNVTVSSGTYDLTRD